MMTFYLFVLSSLVASIIFYVVFFFFFKQKTAYEMRISDWSSDVCSSDLIGLGGNGDDVPHRAAGRSLATEVPIGVVGDVGERRRGCRRAIVDRQVVLFIERIGGVDRHFAGITLIAIGADVAQGYRGGRPGRNLGQTGRDTGREKVDQA